MKKYARIYEGRIFEFFETDGDITTMFHIDFVWVDVTDAIPAPAEDWNATETDGVWSFAPYVPPPPTDAEIVAANTAKLQQVTQLAAAQKAALSERISQINDAIDFGDATPAEEAELPVRTSQLAAWKRYSTLLGRVTLQSGWALTVEWPTQPAQGMDLTVSASAPETV